MCRECNRGSDGLAMEDVVYTYRIGGGPGRSWCTVVTLDALPSWTTLAQLEYLATYSRPASRHWLVRSGGKATACAKFERAIEIATRWAKALQPGELMAHGRLAPPELVEQLLAKTEDGHL